MLPSSLVEAIETVHTDSSGCMSVRTLMKFGVGINLYQVYDIVKDIDVQGRNFKVNMMKYTIVKGLPRIIMGGAWCKRKIKSAQVSLHNRPNGSGLIVLFLFVFLLVIILNGVFGLLSWCV